MSKKLARPCDNLLSEIRTKALLSREISEKGGRPAQSNEKPFPIDAPNVQNAWVVN
jgi:hypothetical protein